MWLRTRKKHWNWKKKEMMHSRRRNTKLPRNFIRKHLKWILTRDQFGQIGQYVEMQWRNMKMLWLTVYPLFQLIRKILRRVFKVFCTSTLTLSWIMTHGPWVEIHFKFWKFENPTKTITQKGNALLGLGQFDEAKECYESLHEVGENSAADQYLKKLHDTQEKDIIRVFFYMIKIINLKISFQKKKPNHAKRRNRKNKLTAIFKTKFTSGAFIEQIALWQSFFTDNKSMRKNDQMMCLHLFIICQSVMKYFLQKSFHDQSLPAWSPRSHF